MSTQITCQICQEQTHVIRTHLRKSHPEVDVEQYQKLYPLAPLLSPAAEDLLHKRSETKIVTVAARAAPTDDNRQAMHEVFGFGDVPASKGASGLPIMIEVLAPQEDQINFLPAKDPGYIFDINLTKTVIQGLEMNIPTLLWGHAGVGKTSLYEQVAAHTGRGFLRVQHTANTEEGDVEGRWTIQNGQQVFEEGPLPQAMRYGLVYCADEYDFASPAVLSLYQAVLEGKPLYIKACNRRVEATSGFRFVATGNTNGAGDDSGLYQGTQLQNAANYERFGIVERVEYWPEAQEVAVLQGRFGLRKDDAVRMVAFANRMRAAFDRREVAIPLSPRALQNATKLGQTRNDLTFGLTRAYINRLPGMSARFATEVMQRDFG